jgi:Ca2+-binding RTX toxin-like protein
MRQCGATKLFVDQLRETIMTIRNVGPSSTYTSIAAAVAASDASDTIRLDPPGYSNETAVLSVQDLTVLGGGGSRNIALVLESGINNVTLAGVSDINVSDNSGSNAITGNDGDNVIRVSGGADVVLGGGGIDRLKINYADAATSVIGTVGSVTDGGTNSVTFDLAVENFTIYTGTGNDTVTTGDGDNLLRTGLGDDTITAGHGNSLVESGGGHDTVEVGDGQNTVRAGAGDDTVTTGDGGNSVNAGDGNNTVTTGAGADIVATGSGDDTLLTGGGADLVQVSGGTDTLGAGVGHDRLTVDYGHLLTNVTGSLSAGSVANGYSGLIGDTAGNSVSYTGVEHFRITTGTGNDDVSTGAGNDTLIGGAGDDLLSGASGNDVLAGGSGADTLTGGRGKDMLTGNAGDDTFRFDDLDSRVGASDRITDLQALDTIDVSLIDADVSNAGDQAFVFVGSFSGAAGQATARYQASGNVTTFAFDTNGDSVADIAIIAVGDHRAHDSFVL